MGNTLNKKIEKSILKHALINALLHDGKADPSAVVKKIVAEIPDAKKLMRVEEERKKLMKRVEEVCEKIKDKSFEDKSFELREKFDRKIEEIEEAKSGKTRKGLPPLPNAEEFEEIRLRFAPAPSGALHIGHLVRAAYLCSIYAEKYDGQFILRIEDTDPQRIKRPYYEMIKEDLKSAGIKWDKLVIESENIDKYYEVARKLFKRGKAYVCLCSHEELKDKRNQKVECKHREGKDNITDWEAFLEDYGEGEAVVRLKTNMQHKNPVLRDPPLLRIIESPPHPRTGYRYKAYPLYNFACAVEDHRLHISHVIRGKDHETNELVQREIYDAMNWKLPLFIEHGLITLPGKELHKRKIRAAMSEGKISGWDDLTLPTVSAFIRRGFLPKTFRKLSIHLGMTKKNAELSRETLYSINRSILSPIARRIFFVSEPLVMKIKNSPRKVLAEIPWIPDKEVGNRRYLLRRKDYSGEHLIKIYVSNEDIDIFEKVRQQEKKLRLKNLTNITINEINKGKKQIIAEYAGDKPFSNLPIVHWVPYGELALPAKVLYPNGSEKKGYTELLAQNLEVGEVIQMERVGFGRVDKNEGEIIKIAFAHP